MKRITKIHIENYKAYIQSEDFILPKGQNLLLYGENGSGKSSLYHALQYFMESSVNNSRSFDVNYYSGSPQGKIEVTFCDYNLLTNNIDTTNCQTICLTESPSSSNTTNNPLLTTGFRVSGFLDYSTLLKVYLNKGARPNLFNLVCELLSDYIAINQGLTDTIGSIIKEVNTYICKCHHRTDNEYVRLKNLFSNLQIAFPGIVCDLNKELKRLMTTYFKEFDLNIILSGIQVKLVEDSYIRYTKIDGELFLDVSHFGLQMPEYNTALNEARLSAIALCLYLASLKLRSVNHEAKILYLDDVFVGLDSANRRPVIKMLLSEFSDYQILISTYDKSWYMLAREIINDEIKWEYKELYEGHVSIAGNILPKPVIVSGKTEIEMARKHLYDNLRPDYPAAANYMRKAYESLLSNNLYRPAILTDNIEPIAAYRLSALIKIAIRFLSLIHGNAYATLIKNKMCELSSNLKPMLHPLSHYAPDEPVYKTELMIAERLYDETKDLLDQADYQHNCKVVITKGGSLVFRVTGSSGWVLEYYLETEANMISYVDSCGIRKIADTTIHVFEIKEYKNGSVLKKMPIGKNNKLRNKFTYKSVYDCYSKILLHIKSPSGENKSDVIEVSNIYDLFFLPKVTKKGTSKIKFKNKLTKEI